ncbi:MAG: 50S ribosomal protein L25 [Candidatus Falkowbacteria bacterium]
MTTKVQLNAQLRSESNGKAKKIRATGFIPAVIYGFGKANQNIKVKKHDFEKVFTIAGEFNLVDLSIGEAVPAKVIIKDVQRDGITDSVIHVDFYQVDMTKKITTEIPLNFIGEAKIIKELGGTLVKNMDTVEVECLPGDLVSHIDVDISILENFDQFIRLHDLVLPNGIVLVQVTNEAVVGAVETEIEEEAPEPVEVAPVEDQDAASEQEKTVIEAKDAPEKK